MSSQAPTYTLAEGAPVADATTAQRVGRGPVRGLMLLQDTQLLETLAHFNREPIPERVVHASAVGAWGEFEVTHDNSDITSADFLNGIGKKTKVLSRISTVGANKGSAETIRDVRGFSWKIFTEEGNQDFVFNSMPAFFIRDPIKFPSLNRAHKRLPDKNIPDASMFWDYHNNNPEGIHTLMMLFSDRGTPASLRNMNAYGNHTYKFTKEDNSFVYVKFHLIPDKGVKTMSSAEAKKLAGEQPDYHSTDMWDAIERGDLPTWTFNVQVMTAEEAEKYHINIFDTTKVWPHSDYPLRPLGKLTLNRNPANHFADVEQAAFSPSTNVPGIAPSADPILQARMFAYPDAQRYRLGANYQQLPVNRPVSEVYSPYQRDGAMNTTKNYGNDPNYVGASTKTVNFKGKVGANGQSYDIGNHDEWVWGKVESYASEMVDADYEQARGMWALLGKAQEQDVFISNVAGHLGSASKEVQKGAIEQFAKVHSDLGKGLQAALETK